MGLGRELEDYTIVSVEQAVAAPYCGLLLADAGARVIKVERPGGDIARAYDRAANGHSAYFTWLNRGKQSIVLDIDDRQDSELLREILDGADVLLQNLAPGSLEKRGLTGPKLRQANPGLITCEITGYGREGPYAQMKAYDLLVQAESGLCAVTGTADSPARVGFSVCDIATGLTAFSAILRALLARAKTGKGLDISISLFDVMADWMNVPLIYQRYLGTATPRIGLTHPVVAPYGLYRAGDGGEVPGQVVLGDPAQVEALAARQDGHRHLADLGGGEDEDDVLRRLLEGLEQAVEGLPREHVHLVDDVDLLAASLRRDADGLAQVADVFDLVVRGGIDLEDAEAAAFLEVLARRTLAARFGGVGAVFGRRGAVDGFGQDAGRRRLTNTTRAAEEIGMGQPVEPERILEGLGHVLLRDQFMKQIRAVFARGDEVTLSRHQAVLDKTLEYTAERAPMLSRGIVIDPAAR